ncbi:MAG: efflux RND transporter periplasmic adaptor subunit [Helicobacteraceae bacterium]|jgi:membrane fusion protein (multidrug efflux system)|nr:efflux RND transporter periplasmic adaptor subunit [Helicobacteraceae bacterium]
MRKRVISFAPLFATLILIAPFLSSCDKSNADEKKQGAQATAAMQAMPVGVFTAQEADVEVSLEYPARAISSGFVEVRAKVGGALMSRKYNEGEQVKKDAVLFVIDPAKYKAAHDMAKAQFDQANREYQRAKKLFSQKAISERDRDSALAAYESSRASLANASLDLDYTQVKAPIDGFAGLAAMDTGNLISAGALLTTITKTDPIYAEFAFSDFESLKTGYEVQGDWKNYSSIKVSVRSESGADYPNKGKLDFIDSSIDINTGSVKARAVLPNPMNQLTPGQFVRVVLTGITKKGAVKVPSQGVMQGNSGPFVYLVKEGKAMIQPVKIASESTDSFVISSGLKSGDQVIMTNLTKLRPGAPVQVMQMPPAGAIPPAGAPAGAANPFGAPAAGAATGANGGGATAQGGSTQGGKPQVGGKQ